MIFQIDMPRISQELKDLLKLSPDTRIGDWYIFKNHIVLRLNGFEEERYLLPTFDS